MGDEFGYGGVQVRAEDNVLDEPSLPDKDHGRMTPRRFAQTLADRGQGVPGIELSSQQVADLRQKPPPGLGLFQLVKQPMGLAEIPGRVHRPDDLSVRVGDDRTRQADGNLLPVPSQHHGLDRLQPPPGVPLEELPGRGRNTRPQHFPQ